MIWKAEKEMQTDVRKWKVQYFVDASDGASGGYSIGIDDGESRRIARSFCVDREEAVRVAKILWRMGVTPVTFFDVVEDYLAMR